MYLQYINKLIHNALAQCNVEIITMTSVTQTKVVIIANILNNISTVYLLSIYFIHLSAHSSINYNHPSIVLTSDIKARSYDLTNYRDFQQ